MADVGVFAQAVANPFHLLLPSGTIDVSSKLIYIGRVSIMIQLNVAEASPEGMYTVVYVIGCVLE
jgi:hypothetical protein